VLVTKTGQGNAMHSLIDYCAQPSTTLDCLPRSASSNDCFEKSVAQATRKGPVPDSALQGTKRKMIGNEMTVGGYLWDID
jgi:hypothetical protein